MDIASVALALYLIGGIIWLRHRTKRRAEKRLPLDSAQEMAFQIILWLPIFAHGIITEIVAELRKMAK